MIILQINVTHLALSELKRYSPVSTDRDGPLADSVTFESMEVETMRINVSKLLRCLQHIQAPRNPGRQFG
ncbi:MAG: hypothetical protein JWM21_569 [Acidobacteria bacterium]|nr:hypothetical protein [Acidobacteriota bacterium]